MISYNFLSSVKISFRKLPSSFAQETADVDVFMEICSSIDAFSDVPIVTSLILVFLINSGSSSQFCQICFQLFVAQKPDY
jgi:hypothetical protein